MHSSDVLADWPDESWKAAQLVVDKYGEPHESTGLLKASDASSSNANAAQAFFLQSTWASCASTGGRLKLFVDV